LEKLAAGREGTYRARSNEGATVALAETMCYKSMNNKIEIRKTVRLTEDPRDIGWSKIGKKMTPDGLRLGKLMNSTITASLKNMAMSAL
jgi:hypothetical protein